MRKNRWNTWIICILGCCLATVLTLWMTGIPFFGTDADEPGICCDRQGPDSDPSHDAIGDLPDYLQPFHPIATIGDEVITYRDFQEYALQNFGRTIIKQLLDDFLVRKEAAQWGLKVTEEEIEDELSRMMQGYESERHFYETMEKQLGMTKRQIMDDIRHMLLLEKIATRDITITEEEVQQYIRDHPDEWMADVKLHIRRIVVQNRETAEQLMDTLRQGGDFFSLAARYPEEEYPNGDLGWVEWNDPFVPEAILTTARQMTAGEFSGPIRLDDGTYAVVYLQGRQDYTPKEIEKREEALRRQLALNAAPSLQEVLEDLYIKHNVVIIDPRYK